MFLFVFVEDRLRGLSHNLKGCSCKYGFHAGMLEAAKKYMGVKKSKHLKIFHADGLDFIRSDFNSCTRRIQGYDIIILDVAVPAQVNLTLMICMFVIPAGLCSLHLKCLLNKMCKAAYGCMPVYHG